MMILVCMMLAGCGSKTEMYLEQSGTEVFEEESENSKFSDTEFRKTGTGGDHSQASGNDYEGDQISEAASQKSGGSGEKTGASYGDSGGTIAVYVCGEVKNPGVYELTDGMRICDAIEAAGGFTKQAGREYWNLAQLLTDGQMLCVPTEAEAKKREAEVSEVPRTTSDTGGQKGTSSGGDAGALVNINTADATLLTSIPGIGQVRAEAVITYRQEHGSFQSIEDIKKVSGIGDALFAKMKDYITVS